MKACKKWVIFFLATNAILFTAITVLVYVMDPLQYFRPIKFYKPVYSYNKRLVIPGIIQNCQFDTIIIGSSIAQNFKPSQVEELFGGSCVKLTAPGLSAKEMSMFFEELAKRKDIKLVIQGIDFFAYAGAPTRLRTEQPDYLYGLNPKNFYKYFYDAYIIKKILTKTDWSTVFDSKQYTFDHDRFAYNGDRKKPSYQETVRSYFSSNYSVSFCGDNYSQESKESFRQNFVSIASENPDTKFYVFFSPYSILEWLIREQQGDVEKLLEFRSFVTEQCETLENVQLFDFQADEKITHNLSIYCDVTHYDESINELIISGIYSGRYRTNPEKCEQSNNEILQQIENFKVKILPTLQK